MATTETKNKITHVPDKKPTVNGLAYLIWSSLNAVRERKCSESDCKEAINNLIRAYGHHRTLIRGKTFFHSRAFFEEFQKSKDKNSPPVSYLEHVVPVKVIMNIMIKHTLVGEIKGTDDVIAYLKELLIVCRVTKQEERSLRGEKLGSKMHKTWDMSYLEIKKNKFLRYQSCCPAILHISDIDHWCVVPRTRIKILDSE